MSSPWIRMSSINPLHTMLRLDGPVTVPVIGPGLDEVWNGSGGDDTKSGTNGVDTLDGKGGNDTISGLGDADTIIGGLGNDSLFGGDGNDTIHIGEGDDITADGGNNDDTFVVAANGGTIGSIIGGLGFDTVDATALATNWFVSGASGVEQWLLSEGNETFTATGADEIFHGNGGDDVIDGGGGADDIFGGTGNDALTGNIGDDEIDGGDDNDLITPGAGNDDVDGGDGFDTIYFTGATIAVEVSLKAGTATGEGTDTIDNVEAVVGSAFNDKLIGSNAANNLVGGLGNDQMDGGKGDDWLYYQTAGNITVNLATGKASGAEGKDKLKNIENVVAFSGADKLTGDNKSNQLFGDLGNDKLDGGEGDDFVFGEEGNDDLFGGNGIDVMEGGTGNDDFIFGPIAAGNIGDNFINDLENGDSIDLSEIDAKVAQEGDQAFKIVNNFHNKAGEATLAFNGVDTTFLSLDTDGDGVANFRIVILGDHDAFANIIL
jgi:Ca2+-binding RTX toxin-like protein